MDLGLEALQVLFDVTLPIIAPAIMSGWLLAFTIVARRRRHHQLHQRARDDDLATLIWGKVKLGVTPDINALATMIVLVVGIGVATAGLMMYRAEKRRELERRLAYQANE